MPALQGTGTIPLTITTESGNWRSIVDGSASRVVTVYGDRGHVGPLSLQNPSQGPRAVSTFSIPDIGDVQSVKVSNEGLGEWELESLDLLIGGFELTWMYDGFLVSRMDELTGGRGGNAHVWTFYAENAIRPTEPSESMLVIQLLASARSNSNTADDIFATVTGTDST